MLEKIVWEKIIDHMPKDGPGCVHNFPDIGLVLMLHIGKARGSGGIWRSWASRRSIATSPCDGGIDDCLKGNAIHVETCQSLARGLIFVLRGTDENTPLRSKGESLGAYPLFAVSQSGLGICVGLLALRSMKTISPGVELSKRLL